MIGQPMTPLEAERERWRQEDAQRSYRPEGDRLAHATAVTARKLRCAIDETLAPLGLTERQYSILCALNEDCINAAQVARVLDVTPQTITNATAILVDKRMLKKGVGHGHSFTLALTRHGRTVMGDARILVDALDRRIRDAFGPREFDSLVRSAEGLLQNLGRAAG